MTPAIASTMAITCRRQAVRAASMSFGSIDTSSSGSPPGACSRNALVRGASPAPSQRVRNEAGPSDVSRT